MKMFEVISTAQRDPSDIKTKLDIEDGDRVRVKQEKRRIAFDPNIPHDEQYDEFEGIAYNVNPIKKTLAVRTPNGVLKTAYWDEVVEVS